MLEHKNKYNIYIKAIALAVAFIFTLNTLVWANPDVFQRGGNNFNLSPPSASTTNIFFPDKTRVGSAVALIAEGIQAPLSEIDLFVPVILHEEGDKKFIGWLDFKSKRQEKGLWIVPCTLSSGKVLNAVFTDDKKLVEMRDDSPMPHRLLEYKEKAPTLIEEPHEQHDVVLDRLRENKPNVPEGKKILVLNFDAHDDDVEDPHSEESKAGRGRTATWANIAEKDGLAHVIHFPSFFDCNDQRKGKLDHNWNTQAFRQDVLKQIARIRDEVHEVWITIDYDFFSLRRVMISRGPRFDSMYHFSGSEIKIFMRQITDFLRRENLWPARVIPAISRTFLVLGDGTPQNYIDIVTEEVNSAFGHTDEGKPESPDIVKVKSQGNRGTVSPLTGFLVLESAANKGTIFVFFLFGFFLLLSVYMYIHERYLAPFIKFKKEEKRLCRYPGVRDLIDAMRRKKMPVKYAVTQFQVLPHIVCMEKETTKSIMDFAATLVNKDITPCSTLEHGVPLAVSLAHQDHARLKENLKVLGRIVEDIHRQGFDPYQALAQARSLAKAFKISRPEELEDVLRAGDLLVKVKKAFSIIPGDIDGLIRDSGNIATFRALLEAELALGGVSIERNKRIIEDTLEDESMVDNAEYSDWKPKDKALAMLHYRYGPTAEIITMDVNSSMLNEYCDGVRMNVVVHAVIKIDDRHTSTELISGYLRGEHKDRWDKLVVSIIPENIFDVLEKERLAIRKRKNSGTVKPKPESPDMIWPEFQRGSEDDASEDNTTETDAGKRFIVDRIKEGEAVEVYEKEEVIYKIRLDRSNPRDPPREEKFKLDGVFKKIRDAKNSSLLLKILEKKKNFRNLTPEQKIRLTQIARDTSISLLLGQVIIGSIDGDSVVTHVRTGYSRKTHDLDPTIWFGEIFLRRIPKEELAQLLLEEAQHILKVYKKVDGRWINLHGIISEAERLGQDPGEVVEHDEDFVGSLDTSPASEEELAAIRLSVQDGAEAESRSPTLFDVAGGLALWGVLYDISRVFALFAFVFLYWFIVFKLITKVFLRNRNKGKDIRGKDTEGTTDDRLSAEAVAKAEPKPRYKSDDLERGKPESPDIRRSEGAKKKKDGQGANNPRVGFTPAWDIVGLTAVLAGATTLWTGRLKLAYSGFLNSWAAFAPPVLGTLFLGVTIAFLAVCLIYVSVNNIWGPAIQGGQPVDMPWWRNPNKTFVAVSLPVFALRREENDPGIGKFADIAPHFRTKLSPNGIKVLSLLPHYAILDESPYSAISLYALNEDYIDWSIVPEVMSHKDRFKRRLVAPYQEVDYEAIRYRERLVLQDAYEIFLKEELERDTPRAVEYHSFTEQNKAWLEDYAKFMALHRIIGKSSLEWSSISADEAKKDAQYARLVELHKFAQWIAYSQFKKAVKDVHQMGGRIIFDIPMFRAKNSVDMWKNKKYFQGASRSPGIINSNLNECWGDLALWNWDELQSEGYKFMLDPVRHWLGFGLDGARHDAIHFAYNFGNGQLASGNEKGDDYVAHLASVFREYKALPLAEAFESMGPVVEAHGIITIDGNWKRLSTHDDGARWYHSDAVNFMYGFNAHMMSFTFPGASKFIMYTLGDTFGDDKTIKVIKEAPRRSFWRYRLPLVNDSDYYIRARYDLGPFIRFRTETYPHLVAEGRSIWEAPEAILPTFKAAAGSFVKHTDGVPEIWAASRDWFFEQWGRDTFISFPGILLTTGRFSEAKELLRSFARLEKDGLIPNRIADPENPEYNTVDGSMWFIQAVRKYVEYTDDWDLVWEMLPAIRNILTGYKNGTGYHRFGEFHEICMDESDGLIVSPAQATWMDADPNATGPVTPRNGKAVEINALWYANLKFMAQITHKLGIDPEEASGWSQLSLKVKDNFNKKFWNNNLRYPGESNERENTLFDVIEGDPHGAAIRPNMAYAVSVADDLLPPERQIDVFRSLTDELLTPYGLRTLSPRDSNYRPHYYTDAQPHPADPNFHEHKDFAYHQGTVWPHLVGPYVDTLVRVRKMQGRSFPEIRSEIRAVLEPLVAFLMTRGSINEVFNGGQIKRQWGRYLVPRYELEYSQYPGGTSSQAWAVAEVLRVMVEYDVLGTGEEGKPKAVITEWDHKYLQSTGKSREESLVVPDYGKLTEKWSVGEDKAGGFLRCVLSISSKNEELGNIRFKVEPRGIVLFSCTGLFVREIGKGHGSTLLIRGFTLAMEEAQKRDMYPRWAYIYYVLNPGDAPDKIEPLARLVRKFGFRNYITDKVARDEAFDDLKGLLADYSADKPQGGYGCWFKRLEQPKRKDPDEPDVPNMAGEEKPESPDISRSEDKKFVDSVSSGDVANPIIIEHIEEDRAIELDENRETVNRIRLDRSNPRDPPLEEKYKSNGTFEKIRKAKDIVLLRRILNEKENFRNLTHSKKEELIKIVQGTPLSLILGQTLVAKTRKNNYAHVRTGKSKEKHGLEPTIWLGELLFDRFPVEKLAQAFLEEAHHILKPLEWTHGKISESENPQEVIEHDEGLMGFMKNTVRAINKEAGRREEESKESARETKRENFKKKLLEIATLAQKIENPTKAKTVFKVLINLLYYIFIAPFYGAYLLGRALRQRISAGEVDLGSDRFSDKKVRALCEMTESFREDFDIRYSPTFDVTVWPTSPSPLKGKIATGLTAYLAPEMTGSEPGIFELEGKKYTIDFRLTSTSLFRTDVKGEKIFIEHPREQKYRTMHITGENGRPVKLVDILTIPGNPITEFFASLVIDKNFESDTPSMAMFTDKPDREMPREEPDFIIASKSSFDLKGVTIEQRKYDVKNHPSAIFPVVQVTLNGRPYKVGKGHYLVITLANGKKVYWGGQHNLSYSFFFEHYREKAQSIIDEGGVLWRHLDAHPDFGSYKDAKKGKHKVVADWREEVEVGIRKLSLADYMGYILTTDIPSEFCSAYYPPELSRLAAKHKANNTVGGVTDIDIDIVVGGEEPASHYEGQERFKKIKEHLLALAEMGDVCFITNSSELDVITHAPLHINPYLATELNGKLIQALAEQVTEAKLAESFREFAGVLRETMRSIRLNIDEENYDAMESLSSQIYPEVRRIFAGPLLEEFRSLLMDSLQDLVAIQFIALTRGKKEELHACLDRTEAMLVEFGKLMAAGRLLEAKGARISSGLLDASLVLNPSRDIVDIIARKEGAPTEPDTPSMATEEQTLPDELIYSVDGKKFKELYRRVYGKDLPYDAKRLVAFLDKYNAAIKKIHKSFKDGQGHIYPAGCAVISAAACRILQDEGFNGSVLWNTDLEHYMVEVELGSSTWILDYTADQLLSKDAREDGKSIEPVVIPRGRLDFSGEARKFYSPDKPFISSVDAAQKMSPTTYQIYSEILDEANKVMPDVPSMAEEKPESPDIRRDMGQGSRGKGDAGAEKRELAERVDRVLALDSLEKADQMECLELLGEGLSRLSHPNYAKYLNEKGTGVKEELNEAVREMQNESYDWQDNFEKIKQLIKRIPTIENPNEDLFVDVLVGFTDEQKRLLASAGGLDELALMLTKGCSNQCLYCGMSKHFGPMQHMPFPLAVKILKELIAFSDTKRVSIYADSEPLDYQDKVIGADVADVLNFAEKTGYYVAGISIITHGQGGARAAVSEGMIKRLPAKSVIISFHLFHIPAKRYLEAKQAGEMSPERETEERERVIRSYVNRFVPLIKGALGSKKQLEIRRYYFDKETKKLLRKHKAACEMIEGFIDLQDEVWERVKEIIGKEVFDKLEADEKIIPSRVMWIGDAAQFLRDLGVPTGVIRKVQDNGFHKGHYTLMPQPNALNILPDGRLSLYTAVEHRRYFAQNRRRFSLLLDLLRHSLKMDIADGAYLKIPIEKTDKSFRDFMVGRNRPGVESYLRDYDAEEKIEEIEYVIADGYLRLITSFFLSEDELRALLAVPTRENIEKLYKKLQYIPLSTRMFFAVRRKNVKEVAVIYYNFFDEPGRDLFDSVDKDVFLIEARVFQEAQSSIPVAEIDTTDDRLSAEAVAKAERPTTDEEKPESPDMAKKEKAEESIETFSCLVPNVKEGPDIQVVCNVEVTWTKRFLINGSIRLPGEPKNVGFFKIVVAPDHYIAVMNYYPIGVPHTKVDWKENSNKGISQTFLFWLSSLAMLNGVAEIHVRTAYLYNFHVFKKYFADEIKILPVGGQDWGEQLWQSFEKIENPETGPGLYSGELMGDVHIIDPESFKVLTYVYLERIKGSTNRYRIIEEDPPTVDSDVIHSGDEITIDETGYVWANGKKVGLTGLTSAGVMLDIRGKPRIPESVNRELPATTEILTLDEIGASIKFPVSKPSGTKKPKPESPDIRRSEGAKKSPSITAKREVLAKEAHEMLRDMVTSKRKTLKRPAVVSIDGDTCVGKSTFIQAFTEKHKGKYHVIHFDDFMTRSDEDGVVDWQHLAREIESLGRDTRIEGVLVEGFRLLDGENDGHFSFDIRVNIVANVETRWANVEKRHPEFTHVETMKMVALKQYYPFDVDYDLRLNNSTSAAGQSPESFDVAQDKPVEGRGSERAKRVEGADTIVFSHDPHGKINIEGLEEPQILLPETEVKTHGPSIHETFKTLRSFFDNEKLRRYYIYVDSMLSELIINAQAWGSRVSGVRDKAYVTIYFYPESKVTKLVVKQRRANEADWKRLSVTKNNFNTQGPIYLLDKHGRRHDKVASKGEGLRTFAQIAEQMPAILRYTRNTESEFQLQADLYVSTASADTTDEDKPESPDIRKGNRKERRRQRKQEERRERRQGRKKKQPVEGIPPISPEQAERELDRLVDAYVGGEKEIRATFAKESWPKDRKEFNVGGGREAVRLAISRTIRDILGKYLSDTDRTIINVGAGEGWLETAVDPQWIKEGRIVPFDINPNFLARIKERGLCQEFIEGDAHNLSEYVQGADAIIASDSYDTFEDLEKVVEESYKALKPGGKLIVFQTIKTAPQPLYEMMKKMGIVYCPQIDAFFPDREMLRHVMRPFAIASLKGKLGDLSDEHYRQYTLLRLQCEIDLTTLLFHPLLVMAMQKAGFNLLQTGGIKSNVLADIEKRHRVVEAYHGTGKVPENVNMLDFSHGITSLRADVPGIPKGKILEQAEIIAVVAEKPIESPDGTMPVTVLGKTHQVKKNIWENIVPATPDDAEVIFRLSQTIHDETSERGTRGNVDTLRTNIARGFALDGRPVLYLVHKENGTVKGYIGAEITPITNMIKILQTAVDESCRGRGIATVLCAKLMRACERKGLKKFLRRPIHPHTQKVARRFGYVPIQGEGIPTLVSKVGYWGANVAARDVFHEFMSERIAQDIGGTVTAIDEHNTETVRNAIYNSLISLWLSANRVFLNDEDRYKVYKKVAPLIPTLNWIPSMFDIDESGRIIEILSLVFGKDLPWMGPDWSSVGTDYNPAADLVEAGIRYWLDGEGMRREVFEELKQGNVIPLPRYRYLKGLNEDEEMGKVRGGVSVEDTEEGILLTRGDEKLLCTHEMMEDWLRRGRQPGKPKPRYKSDDLERGKPESPDIRRGEDPGSTLRFAQDHSSHTGTMGMRGEGAAGTEETGIISKIISLIFIFTCLLSGIVFFTPKATETVPQAQSFIPQIISLYTTHPVLAGIATFFAICTALIATYFFKRYFWEKLTVTYNSPIIEGGQTLNEYHRQDKRIAKGTDKADEGTIVGYREVTELTGEYFKLLLLVVLPTIFNFLIALYSGYAEILLDEGFKNIFLIPLMGIPAGLILLPLNILMLPVFRYVRLIKEHRHWLITNSDGHSSKPKSQSEALREAWKKKSKLCALSERPIIFEIYHISSGTVTLLDKPFYLVQDRHKRTKEIFIGHRLNSLPALMYGAPEDASGFVRIDPPKEENVPNREVLFYRAVKLLLEASVNSEKDLVLTDESRGIVENGYNVELSSNITLGSFVKAIEKAKSGQKMNRGKKERKSIINPATYGFTDEALVRDITITVKHGIHARTAKEIVELCNRCYPGVEVAIFKDDRVADGTSLIQLLTLGASQNVTVRVVAYLADVIDDIEIVLTKSTTKDRSPPAAGAADIPKGGIAEKIRNAPSTEEGLRPIAHTIAGDIKGWKREDTVLGQIFHDMLGRLSKESPELATKCRILAEQVAEAEKTVSRMPVEPESALDFLPEQMKIVRSGKPLEFGPGLLYHGRDGLDEVILNNSISGEIPLGRTAHFEAKEDFINKSQSPAIFVISTDLFNGLMNEGRAILGISDDRSLGAIDPYPEINGPLSLDVVEEIWIDMDTHERYERIVKDPATDKERALKPKIEALFKAGKIKVIPDLRHTTTDKDRLAGEAVGKYIMSRGLLEQIPLFKERSAAGTDTTDPSTSLGTSDRQPPVRRSLGEGGTIDEGKPESPDIRRPEQSEEEAGEEKDESPEKIDVKALIEEFILGVKTGKYGVLVETFNAKVIPVLPEEMHVFIHPSAWKDKNEEKDEFIDDWMYAFRQVFMEVFKNALEGRYGLTSGKTRSKTIHITVEGRVGNKNEDILINIKDDGDGIIEKGLQVYKDLLNGKLPNFMSPTKDRGGGLGFKMLSNAAAQIGAGVEITTRPVEDFGKNSGTVTTIILPREIKTTFCAEKIDKTDNLKKIRLIKERPDKRDKVESDTPLSESTDIRSEEKIIRTRRGAVFDVKRNKQGDLTSYKIDLKAKDSEARRARHSYFAQDAPTSVVVERDLVSDVQVDAEEQVRQILSRAYITPEEAVASPHAFYYEKLMRMGIDPFTPEEHLLIFDYLWSKNGLDLEFPEKLKARIIGVWHQLERGYMSCIVRGAPDGSIIAQLVDLEVITSDEEERFMWHCFHLQAPDWSNRSLEDIRERAPDMMTEVESTIHRADGPVKVLELGCGPTGRALRDLKYICQDKMEASGVDIEIYNENIPGVTLKQANIRHLPFANNSFDLIYEFLVLDPLKGEALKKTISEAIRVLKPGGKFVISMSTSQKEIRSILDGLDVKYEIRNGEAFTITKKAPEPTAGTEGRGHAPGHPATFFKHIYMPIEGGGYRTFEFETLRRGVLVKKKGSLKAISESRAKRDLSKLVMAGLVKHKRKWGLTASAMPPFRFREVPKAYYTPTITSNIVIEDLYMRLSKLKADASREDVQNVVRRVVEVIYGGKIEIETKRGGLPYFTIHLPSTHDIEKRSFDIRKVIAFAEAEVGNTARAISVWKGFLSKVTDNEVRALVLEELEKLGDEKHRPTRSGFEVAAKLADEADITNERTQEYLDHDQKVLRDLIDEEELPTNLLEMLIGLNYNNKVVFAFEDKLAEGRDGKPFNSLLLAIKNLKRNPKYEKILKNLVVIPASVDKLPLLLEMVAGQKNTKVFTFTRKTKEAQTALSELQTREGVQAVFIDENKMPGNAYYPLAEIVTITLAQVFVPKIINTDDIHSLTGGLDLAQFNIEAIRREGKAIIFTLLPDAEEMRYQDLIKRYAELKRFLKAA